MKYTAIFVAIAGLVSAQNVDPAQATASLLAALPTSLQQLALTNLPAASSAISSAIANPTGPPAWFTSLPGAVQTYFITAAGGSVSSSAAGSGASSAASAASSGASSARSAASSAASAASSAAKSGSSSSSSAGAVPTAVIGSGIAGAVGIVAMLAL